MVTVEGTPSRSGAAQDAANQRYQAPGTGWKDWVNDDIPLRWYAPSLATASPWKLKREVSFTAKFSSPVVTITKMDLETGEVETGPPSVIWTDDDTQKCKSADLKVTVNRARNFR